MNITQRNKQLAIVGALSALIILMGIPGLHIGYIPLPTVSLTTMPIPVIISAIFTGLPGALITGFMFGVTSLINAAVNPPSAIDALFVWPQLSILPRLLFALVAWGVWVVISTIAMIPKSTAIKNTVKVSASVLCAFFSTVAHSWMVYAALFLFLGDDVQKTLGATGYWAWIAVRLPHTLTESAITAVIVALVLGGTLGITYKKPKLISDIQDDS